MPNINTNDKNIRDGKNTTKSNSLAPRVSMNSRTDLPPVHFLDPRPVRHFERISDLLEILFVRDRS